MKLLFCHDGPLREKDGVFYGIAHTNEVFKRYMFNECDTIEILIRTAPLDKSYSTSNLSELSLKNLKVISTPDFFKDIKKRKNREKIIEESVVNCDFLIIRLPSFIGLSAIKFAKRHKKRYMIEFVADPWDSFWNHSYKGKIIAPIVTFLNKRAVKSAPSVLYVTNEYLQTNYPSEGFTIGCSDVVLDNSKPNFSRYKNKVRSKIKIGTLAAIDVRFKGQDCVIKALGQLKKEGYTNFEYQLVGSGSEEYLKKLAIKYEVEDQVVFLGALPHEKVFDWLSILDIYIQPSKQEGLPRALVEAMSTGTFCIGSKTGGIPELIESKYIFSNKKKNYQEISEHLKKFNYDEAYRSGKINYEKSLLFRRDALEEKRNEFFKKIMKNA